MTRLRPTRIPEPRARAGGRTRAVRCALALGLAAGAWLAPGCRAAGPASETVTDGGLTLEARVDPPEGRVGANRLELRLRDAAGRALDDAEVSARVEMPAMGAMPAMGGALSLVADGGGRFHADFAADMGGTWQVEVRVRAADGATLDAEGSFQPGSGGLSLRPSGGSGAPSADARSAPGEFRLAPERLQQIGVRLARAERRALGERLRAVARVALDETRLVDVSPRVSGFAEEVRVDALGDRVERGETLFTLYSPQLFSAQAELQQALARARREPGNAAAERLARAARTRLRLLGVGERELDRIAAADTPLEAVPFRAPASGYVFEKRVVEGASVMAGERLYRIAPLDPIWIEADLYPADLAHVAVGAPVQVRSAAGDAPPIAGRVAWLQPALAADSRTLTARIELANPGDALRPEMWTDVEIALPAGEALAVPSDAVLPTGERNFVFVSLGGGRLRPREVQVGRRDGEWVEIRSGLEEGDEVVASGTFLVASESRLRAALEQW